MAKFKMIIVLLTFSQVFAASVYVDNENGRGIINLSGGTLRYDEQDYSKIGGFTSYTFQAGDRLRILDEGDGTGEGGVATLGYVDITGKSNNNIITLEQDFTDGSNCANVTAVVIPGLGPDPNEWQTIQAALDHSQEGDTIYVQKTSTTYTLDGSPELAQSLHIDDHNDLWVEGYKTTVGDMSHGGSLYKDSTDGWVVIDGNAGDHPILANAGAGGIIWENFKFQNCANTTACIGSADDNKCMIDLCDDSGTTYMWWPWTFRNCWFVGNKAAGGTKSGIMADFIVSLVVTDCKFTGDWDDHLSVGNGAIVGVNHQVISSEISYCTVDCSGGERAFNIQPGEHVISVTDYGNLQWGYVSIHHNIIDLSGTARANAAVIKTTGISEICDNTLYTSGAGIKEGIEVNREESYTYERHKIYNNIIKGNSEEAILVIGEADDDGFTLVFQDYNCYSDNSETHGLSSDPQFVDPANDDFRLNPGSPCINAGYTPDASTFGRSTIGAWQPYSIAESSSRSRYQGEDSYK